MRCSWLFVLACLLVACESGAVAGTPCSLTSDCRSPLACRFGRCRNECRENRDCANGARCLLDQEGLGACSLVSDERCGSGGTECPTGLTCVNDRCANTCSGPDDCPADGECREAISAGVSFCFAPDREDGGMPDDAGDVVDAGATDASQMDVSRTDAGPRPGPLAIAVGEDAVCVVANDHRVLCWGSNSRGQLGDGTSDTMPRDHADDCSGADCSLTPVEVLVSTDVPLLATDIAAAPGTFCAVHETDGRAYCWGSCDEQMCDMTGPHVQAHALAVPMITASLVDVHGGRAHFCARASDGAVWCWGQNGLGQMGIGSFTSYFHGEATAWRDAQLAVGASTTCALFGDGTVACAGRNAGGTLGPGGTLGENASTPILVPLTPDPSVVVAAAGFACALVDGTPWCWGESVLGKLGRTSPGECVVGTVCDPDPTPVEGGVTFTQLWSEGFANVTCAGNADGDVYCWGAREFGQSGPTFTSGPPGLVAGLQSAVEVAMGIDTTCGVLASGVVRCMGSNAHGELQSASDRLVHATPVDVCIDTTCP